MKKVSCLLAGLSVLLTFSCDDVFGEMNGGNGGGLDSTEVVLPYEVDSIVALFDYAYPMVNYAPVSEFMSDNIVDNNSPNMVEKGNIKSFNLDEIYDWTDDVFAFEGSESEDTDSPRKVFEEYMRCADLASAYIEIIENAPDTLLESRGEIKLKSLMGEAYVIRSFTNFILNNIFSHSYVVGPSSRAVPYRLGISETAECTVAEAYNLILNDFEEGMNLLEEYGYPDSKYRFNKNAVYAFGARLNLYMRNYDKTIYFADQVLGSGREAELMMRNFYNFNKSMSSIDDYVAVWTNEKEPATFMFLDTFSSLGRNMLSGTRYAHNTSALLGTSTFTPSLFLSIPPVWIATGLLSNGKQEYGLFNLKNGETFELVDTLQGYGYAKVKKLEFTAEETLLCRAEAKLMTGNVSGAFDDLVIWDDSKKKCMADMGSGPEDPSKYYRELTIQGIKDSYVYDSHVPVQAWASCYYDGTVMNDMLSNIGMLGYNVQGEDAIAVLRCLLHFRRFETLFDGLRFFDLKRLGIDYQHNIGKNGSEPARVEEIRYDDDRRALKYESFINNGEVESKGMTDKRKLVRAFDMEYSRVNIR